MAVAGFATANVMLLSIAVWSGAGEMTQSTRTLLHWVSGAIALPAVAYAARPFFGSAFRALKARRVNMDVPISLGVSLACALSVYETVIGHGDAYFDAAVMLLFFLLIGRYLDMRLRARAGAAAGASPRWRRAPRAGWSLTAVCVPCPPARSAPVIICSSPPGSALRWTAWSARARGRPTPRW